MKKIILLAIALVFGLQSFSQVDLSKPKTTTSFASSTIDILTSDTITAKMLRINTIGDNNNSKIVFQTDTLVFDGSIFNGSDEMINFSDASITVVKTPLKIDVGSGGGLTFTDLSSSYVVKVGATNAFVFAAAQCQSQTIRPISTGNDHLGTETGSWGNAYIMGAILNATTEILNLNLDDNRAVFKVSLEMSAGDTVITPVLIVSDTAQIDGVLKGIEITTPSLQLGYWSLYGKSDNLLYFLDGAGNEQSVGGIQSDFASMTISSGGATVIDGSSTWHAYIDAGVGNLSTNWTFIEGARTDLTGATFATSGGGSETQITGVTHNLSVDDYVTLSGSSTGGYNTTTSTVHQVSAVGSSTDFTLDVAFVDDPGTEGFVIRGDQLVAGTNASGTYIVQCSASGFISTNAANCQFGVFKNGALEAKRDRRFSNATDRGAWNFANGRIITIVATDVVWIGILNEDNSNNITISDQDFSFHKL